MKKIGKIIMTLAIVLSLIHISTTNIEASSHIDKFVSIALKEVGNGYKSKYGSKPWCASFISWSARSAGISTGVIPSTSSTQAMYSTLMNNGGKKVTSPQKGDLVFYKHSNGSGICHAAIMTSSTMSVHGNYSNKVKHIPAASYEDSSGKKTTKSRMIFVRPNYGNSSSSSGSTNNSTGHTKPSTGTTKPSTSTSKPVVKKVNVSKLTVKGITPKVEYSAKQIKPSITLYNGNTKVSSSNYTVTYGENTQPGKATVKITGKNNYTGTLIKTFTILAVDYSKLNEVKSKVPADLSVYTDETVKALNDVLTNINGFTNKTLQKTVDQYITALNNAINALVLKPADYSKIEELKTLVPTDLTIYTEDSVKTLEDALNAVIKDKNITEQSEVDKMALSIETAINALEKKPPVLEMTIGMCGATVVLSGIYLNRKKIFIHRGS